MSIRYELYVKPDYNFLHWLRDEDNTYKGHKFWKYFTIKKVEIAEKGVTVDFIQMDEEGVPHVTYHYYSKRFSFGALWNFTIYDNFEQAWRYLDVPQFYASFQEVVNTLLTYYGKKINYGIGQFLS